MISAAKVTRTTLAGAVTALLWAAWLAPALRKETLHRCIEFVQVASVSVRVPFVRTSVALKSGTISIASDLFGPRVYHIDLSGKAPIRSEGSRQELVARPAKGALQKCQFVFGTASKLGLFALVVMGVGGSQKKKFRHWTGVTGRVVGVAILFG